MVLMVGGGRKPLKLELWEAFGYILDGWGLYSWFWLAGREITGEAVGGRGEERLFCLVQKERYLETNV